MATKECIAEVFPILWSNDVGAIADWAVAALGLTESWRAASDSGVVEHAELHWSGGRVSINIKQDAYRNMGPGGISLRIDDPATVDAIYDKAVSTGARISRDLAESRIAYSFTATDPDGNQWWVNAENGFLDELRNNA